MIGVALPHVGSDLGHPLTHGEQEIITAGCTIGAIFGSAILGSLADKLGRRLALFIADVLWVPRQRRVHSKDANTETVSLLGRSSSLRLIRCHR